MATAAQRPQAYPVYAPAHYDVEKGQAAWDEDMQSGEASMRLGFIRKVFGILSAQLLLTALVAGPIVLAPAVQTYVMAAAWVPLTAMIVSFASLIVLTVSHDARHSYPANLALLTVFTAAEGVLLGVISAQYTLPSVFMAVAMTGGITVGLTLYALRTKRDFTMHGGLLVTLLMGLIMAGFVGMVVQSPLLHTAMAAGGALLFGAYIVVDVQLIAGGQHTTAQLSPDEYIAGAITVYLDIVNLFIYLLRLFGERRD